MILRPYFPTDSSSEDGSAVTSVNGEQGDVVVTAESLNAQAKSSVLTSIASTVMPDNSFLRTDSVGNFTPTMCMPAGVAWLSYTTVDQQKEHLALAEVASTGSYEDLANTPELFSGNYNDLVDKPAFISVPTKTSELINDSGFLTSVPVQVAQVNSDWNSNSGVSQVLNKPNLFSGSYNDLTAKPVLFSGNYNDLTGKPSLFDGTWASLSGKPTLFDGSYVSLTNKPTIPTNTNQLTNGSGYITSSALSGYALTSSLSGYATTASLGSYATTVALTAATQGMRKVETFLGTSDASGNYTITFANTYTTPPDVQPQIIGGTFNQMVRVVSVSNTGCVIQAAQRNLVTLLAIEVLLGATINLVGASVSVQITARN